MSCSHSRNCSLTRCRAFSTPHHLIADSSYSLSDPGKPEIPNEILPKGFWASYRKLLRLQYQLSYWNSSA